MRLILENDVHMINYRNRHPKLDIIEGTKPILHAVNRTAMQIAWIMGYFSYMDSDEPTRYLEFGRPLIKTYGEATHHL
ncbi:MAG: hypothetical protein L3J69_03865 [Desulfobacula sp.]|nr:hypothetical protein [Desulfobacula sp.]